MSARLDQIGLIKMWAAWVNHRKNPYINNEGRRVAKPGSEEAVTVMSKLPNAWVECRMSQNDLLEMTCVHRILTLDEDTESEGFEEEIEQFNSLMDSVRIPAMLWFDGETQALQLRWQDCVMPNASFLIIEQVFDQSLTIANAVHTRFARFHAMASGWAVH